jgi:hypothetical protein
VSSSLVAVLVPGRLLGIEEVKRLHLDPQPLRPI